MKHVKRYIASVLVALMLVNSVNISNAMELNTEMVQEEAQIEQTEKTEQLEDVIEKDTELDEELLDSNDVLEDSELDEEIKQEEIQEVKETDSEEDCEKVESVNKEDNKSDLEDNISMKNSVSGNDIDLDNNSLLLSSVSESKNIASNTNLCTHINISYSDNGDGTHDGICDDCYEVIVDNEEHKDDNNDYICDDCGASINNKITYRIGHIYYDETFSNRIGVGNTTYADCIDGETIYVKDIPKVLEYNGEKYNFYLASMQGNGSKAITSFTPVLGGTLIGYPTDTNWVNLWYKKIANKTYTVIYTDGVKGEIVFTDQEYPNFKEGDSTPNFVGTPTREGYNFTGWSPTFKETISSDDANANGEIVYTAIWEENTVSVPVTVKVRFEGLENKDLTCNNYEDCHSHPKSFYFGGVETNPQGTKGGYYVVNSHGYGIEQDGTPYIFFDKDSDFPNWTVIKGKEYKVHYNLFDYLPSEKNGLLGKYEYVSANDIEDANGVDFDFKADDETPQTLIITLKYEKVEESQKVTLTYNPNGGTGSNKEYAVDKGTDVIIKNNNAVGISRVGFEFLGWSIDKDAIVADWSSGDQMKINQNTTFYAIWKLKAPTTESITYSAYVKVQCSENDEHYAGGKNVSDYSLKNNPNGWHSSKPIKLNETSIETSDDRMFYDVGIEWKATITLKNDYWLDKYDSTNHELNDDSEIITITTYWYNNNWTFNTKNNVYTVFVKCHNIDGLSITKTVDKEIAHPGEDLTYTISVTNSSNVDKEVTVIDVLPNGVKYTSINREDTIFDDNKYTITWTPTIVSNSTESLEIKVKIEDNAKGYINNLATLTAKDGSTKESLAFTKAIPQNVIIKIQFIDEDGKIVSSNQKNYLKNSQYAVTDEELKIPATYEANGDVYGDAISGTADSDKTIFVPIKKITYKLSWYDEDKTTVLDTTTFTEGDNEPAFSKKVPTKEKDKNYTYKFLEWELLETPLNDDNLSYLAKYEQIPIEYGSYVVKHNYYVKDKNGNFVLEETVVEDLISVEANTTIGLKDADVIISQKLNGYTFKDASETMTIEADKEFEYIINYFREEKEVLKYGSYQVIHQYYLDDKLEDTVTDKIVSKVLVGTSIGVTDTDILISKKLNHNNNIYEFDSANKIVIEENKTNVLTIKYVRKSVVEDTKPSEKPSNNKPTDNKPTTNKPSDNKPVDNKPTEIIRNETIPKTNQPNKTNNTNLVNIPDEAVPQASSPITGDNSPILLYVILFFASGIGLVRRKKK